jgi:hypothetical protein
MRKSRRASVKVLWLDVKLGLRMLAKYPGLSLVAVGGMFAVGLLAAAGPARRGLAIEPTEALRAE